MDQKTRKRIIQEESARFLDSQFGGLDLSGSPDLQHPIEDKFEAQDKDGLNRVDLSGLPTANNLKTFLQSPDRETLTEVAHTDPQLAQRLQSDIAGDIAVEFVRRNPNYLSTDTNFRLIVAFLANKHLGRDLDTFEDEDEAVSALMSCESWTVPEIEAAYKKLLRDGMLDVPANQPRNLRETDRLKCAQLAANGDPLGAAVAYIRGRLGEDAADEVAFSLDDPFSFTANPEYRPILEEATLFAFENSRHDYSPTPERRAYLKEYVAERFMTLALLDAAWESCKEAEKDATRGAILGQVESPQQTEDLDGLSDQQIDRLYHGTLRQIAKDSLGVGILQ